ncbi:hypothetical protein HG263_06810 [Pseudoalteromonas sp. JBTF-M23]|uniref:Uncharacterized protein n=1 Tax=Pseudoalteromonas caenipelagi TaxID=2726988 RepID=A0A849VCG7_9GAMM|nr:hypothetical protein [Pseudoalteromonas caenipelagi]NOU50253.1 hypothetical protein [Pseudoalteromonas caenipelagi]
MNSFLKVLFAVFAGTTLSWLTYLFFVEMQYQARVDSVEEQFKAAERNEEARKVEIKKAKKEMKELSGVAACKFAIKQHHGELLISFINVVRATETFAAINYIASDDSYHAQCYISFDSNEVTELNISKV